METTADGLIADKEFQRSVRYRANKLAPREQFGYGPDDLYQVGLLGAHKAALRFDPTKGASLRTYALMRASGDMIDEVRRQQLAPRSAIQKARRDGTQAPRHVGIPEDDDGKRLVDPETLEEHGPAAEAAENDQAAQLRRALRSMDQRLGKFLRLRFLEGRTLKEVGAALGVTEARASQLEPKALLAAQKALSSLFGKRPRRIRGLTGRKRLTDDQRRALVADYFDTDMTMIQVGLKWGLSGASTVYQIVAGPIAVRLFGAEQARANAVRTLRKRADRLARSKRKVSLKSVKEIRDRFRAGGVRVKDLAEEFGVRRETMGSIIYGRQVWGRGVYATLDPVPAPGGKRKLTFAQADELRTRYAAGGESAYDLAASFGISYGVACSILHGRSYQRVPGLPGKRGVNAPSVIAAVNAKLGIRTTGKSAAAHRRWIGSRRRCATSS